MKKLFTALLALISSVAFATTTVPVQLLNPTGSSSGQVIVSTGASSAPGWATVPLSGLSSIAANTVLANATSSSAAPTAFAMPSCSASTNALTWTTNTGFTCNSSINAATLGGATFASPGSIGSTTAASGKFTTLQATSTITPSSTAGIVGTTTNDNANAGSIGEYLSAQSSSTPISNNTSTNITSLSLTAGDWDVSGIILFAPGSGATATAFFGSISTTSATLGPLGTTYQITPVSITAGNGITTPTPVVRISIASTTTVYLVGYSTLSGGTVNTTGFIRARRVR